jgi:hypothetical protein
LRRGPSNDQPDDLAFASSSKFTPDDLAFASGSKLTRTTSPSRPAPRDDLALRHHSKHTGRPRLRVRPQAYRTTSPSRPAPSQTGRPRLRVRPHFRNDLALRRGLTIASARFGIQLVIGLALLLPASSSIQASLLCSQPGSGSWGGFNTSDHARQLQRTGQDPTHR